MPLKLGVVVHTCNPSIGEIETGISKVQEMEGEGEETKKGMNRGRKEGVKEGKKRAFENKSSRGEVKI